MTSLVDAGFSAEQIRALRAPPPPDIISERLGAGRRKYQYVESWIIDGIANAIFGTGNWSAEMTSKSILSDVTATKTKPNERNEPVQVTVRRIITDYNIRISVHTPTGRVIIRTGQGISEHEAETPKEAFELSATKAEAKAKARAFRTFGPAFGAFLNRDSKKVSARPTAHPAPAPLDDNAARPAVANSSTPLPPLPLDHPQRPTVAPVSPNRNGASQPPALPPAEASTATTRRPPIAAVPSAATPTASDTDAAADLKSRCTALKERILATNTRAEHEALKLEIAPEITKIATQNPHFHSLLSTYIAAHERDLRIVDTLHAQLSAARDSRGLAAVLSIQTRQLAMLSDSNPRLHRALTTLIATRTAELPGATAKAA